MKPRFAALAFAVAALAACAHAGPSDAARAATPGQPAVLARGDSLALPDGARLRFAAVGADSRCPPKLQCVWAGDAVLEFEFTAADGARTPLSFNTVSDPRRSAGAWTIEVQGLDFADPPNATLKIDAK